MSYSKYIDTEKEKTMTTLTAKTLTPSEIAKFRIIHVLKIVIGLSKKIVMRANRTMKNGALQFSYLVDGVKCSCFVKKALIEREERNAAIASLSFESSVLENVVLPTLQKYGYGQAKLVEIGWNKPVISLFPSRYHHNQLGYFISITGDSYTLSSGYSVKKLDAIAHAATMQELLNIIKFNVDII